MKREVGLWIDHRKTVMVTMVNEKQETREIRSNIERNGKLAGIIQAKRINGSGLANAEDGSERDFESPLSKYYDGVISLLRNADAIWIFGPGQAKSELKKRLEREELGGRIVDVETVDKMTDRQIAAKVRHHYQY